MAQLPILSLASCPVVHTTHAPLSVDDRWAAERYETVQVVTLTHAQAATLQRPTRVVSSGIDLDRYPFGARDDGHLAFLGRMGPGKNPLGAIEIAAAAGRPLVLAGAPQNRAERDYFQQEIEPRVDGDQVRYLGPVDHPAKVRLLGSASAMLFPITAGEAFGLVMVEAMACGTPVLACRRASVEEVVDPGVTGLYADEVTALAPLVDEVSRLDRGEVRRAAERRFSFRRMGAAYLAMFEELAS